MDVKIKTFKSKKQKRSFFSILSKIEEIYSNMEENNQNQSKEGKMKLCIMQCRTIYK